MGNKLVIAGQQIPPGERRSLSIKLHELPDGTEVRLLVVVVNGHKPGPKLYLGGAVHGDEFNGARIVGDILASVKPADLSGSLIAVPVQNPLAFQAAHRLPLNQLLRSPLDQVPSDMFLAYPGDAQGNTTQVAANLIFTELVSKSDCALDVHTPTTGGRWVPMAFTPPDGLGEASRRSEEAARAFGLPFVVKLTRGLYVHEGTLHVNAAKMGITAFGVELGEGGRIEEDYVAMGVGGVANLMKHLGMHEGEPQTSWGQKSIVGLHPVRAKRAGLLKQMVKLGEPVAKGEQISRIVSLLGEELESLTAPTDGVLVRTTTFPTVCSGELVNTIGKVG